MNSNLNLDLAPNLKPDSFALTFAPLSIEEVYAIADDGANGAIVLMRDRKSTRLNSSHPSISRMPSSA